MNIVYAIVNNHKYFNLFKSKWSQLSVLEPALEVLTSLVKIEVICLIV